MSKNWYPEPIEITPEVLEASREYRERDWRAKQIAGRSPIHSWPTTMLAKGPDGRSAVIWLHELAAEQLAAEAQGAGEGQQAA